MPTPYGLAMTHPGVSGVGYAPDMATFTAVYQPLGWVLSSTPAGTGPLDVYAFGAKGDGVTDDTAAIQLALNAAANATLVFPAGTFKHTQLNLTSNGARLVGMPGATLYQNDPGTSGGAPLYITATDVTIEGLKFTSTSSTRTGVYGLIRCENAHRIIVKDCWFVGGTATAAFFWNCNDARVIGNKVQDCAADGIHFTRGGTRIAIVGNVIDNTGDDGIAINSQASPFTQTSDVSIVGNTLTDIGALQAGRGIANIGGKNVSISGNTINGVEQAGIICGGDESGVYYTADNVTITGNSITGAGRNPPGGGTTQGVYVYSTTDVRLGANHCDDIAFGIAVTTPVNVISAKTGSDINVLSDGGGIFKNSGRYYGGATSSVTAVATTANYLYAAPIYVAETVTIDRIGIHVTTAGAAASVIKLAVYNDTGHFLPGTKRFDAGSVAADSTGAKELTISQQLPGGQWYWLAAVAQGGTPSVYSNTTGNVGQSAAGIAFASSVINTGVSGTLPSTFSVAGELGTAPRVYVRVA